MQDDELRTILQSAERDLAAGTLDATKLAASVRSLRRARHRRRMMWAASVSVVATMAGTGWYMSRDLNSPNGKQAQQVAIVTDEEIQRLEAEAAAHERNARALMVAQPVSSPLDDDPLADIREQIDIVAYRMVQRADELQGDMTLTEKAIEAYRSVLRLFPGTYSAEVAQQRLDEIKFQQESS